MRTAIVCLLSATTSASVLADDPHELIRAQASPLIEHGVVPGLVIGTIVDGASAVHAFGVTASGSADKPDGATVYELGSVTKVFTGVLLAHAELDGRLSIEDEIGRYLPAGVEAPSFDGRAPTLAHLATHTSGFPRLPGNIEPEDMDDPYRGYTTEMMWRAMDGLELNSAPGEWYAYSNLGAGVLGRLAAANLELSYEDALKERITGPLGMHDTSIHLSESQRERLAPGTIGGVVTTGVWDIDGLAPAGALRSTCDDMLRFAGAALRPDGGDASRAIVRSMERLQTPDAGPSMGMCWHIAPDERTRWHNGQTGGSQSFLAVDPESGLAVVVLANGTDPSIERVAQNVLEILRGERPDPPSFRPATQVGRESLERHAGVYRSEHGFDVEVSLVDGDDAERTPVLLARVTGQLKMRLWPVSESRFFYRTVPAEVEFDDEPGEDRSAALVIIQGAERIRCVRVE